MDITSHLLPTLIILLITISTGVSGAAIGSTQSGQPTIAQENIQEEMGDIVIIPVQVVPYNTTTLTISGEQYSTTATVTDKNGDGQVQVQINTFEARNTDRPSGYEVVSPDHLREVSQSGTGGISAGQYTLSVGESTATSKLSLSPGEFHYTQLHTVPAGSEINETMILERRSPVPSQIAHGDVLIAEFEAEGIMGVGRFEDPPGNNGIVPINSTIGAQTGHVIQVSGQENGTEFREVQVDYKSNSGDPPSNLLTINVTHAGIDSDQDGQIDRSIKPAINNINTNSEGVISLRFSKKYNISSTDTLIIRYKDLKNPSRPGTNRATVLLGSDQIDTTVEYGPNAAGNLGNGLNIGINTTSSDQFVAPLPFEYVISPSNDRIYVIIQTNGLNNMTNESITVTLSQAALTENTSKKQLTTEAEIVKPTANIDTVNSQWEINSEQLYVTGTTTLAPNSEIWIRIRSTSGVPSPWIYHFPTTVRSNRTIDVKIREHRINTSQAVYIRPVTRGGPIGAKKEIEIVNGTDDT